MELSTSIEIIRISLLNISDVFFPQSFQILGAFPILYGCRIQFFWEKINYQRNHWIIKKKYIYICTKGFRFTQTISNDCERQIVNRSIHGLCVLTRQRIFPNYWDKHKIGGLLSSLSLVLRNIHFVSIMNTLKRSLDLQKERRWKKKKKYRQRRQNNKYYCLKTREWARVENKIFSFTFFFSSSSTWITLHSLSLYLPIRFTHTCWWFISLSLFRYFFYFFACARARFQIKNVQPKPNTQKLCRIKSK